MNLTDAIEAGARALAMLSPNESWPTNEDLGGSATGTRDDEYYYGVSEDATAVIRAALPYIREQIAQEIDSQRWVSKTTFTEHDLGYDLGITDAARIARGES